ncbi:lymphocyte function-associated antigen 3 isoform X2 [Otolemur garnettii]|nr:lymphocyte function-associated antigen 3 isoform X2 [Otolemur garnettii]
MPAFENALGLSRKLALSWVRPRPVLLLGAMVPRSGPREALLLLCAIFLLLQFDFISCNRLIVYGALNENVTFGPSNYTTTFHEILWKKQKNKVVEWDGSSKTPFPPFVGRVDLDHVSGNLTILNLTLLDEDEYEIESPSMADTVKFFLNVIEHIPSLKLNCTLIDGEIVVQCLIPEHYNSHKELLNYSWFCPWEQCNSHSHSELSFTMDRDLSQQVQCVVSNKVSERKSEIVLETCIPNTGHPRHRYLITASVVLVIAVSAVLFLK